MSTVVARLDSALSGRYRIERELGEGGMATVYLADDLRHGRKVALKVLKPELAAVVGAERFLAEIRTTANLQHPHILPLFDSGEADGLLFYVMPRVQGESLRERLDREHQLPVEEAVRLTTNVAEALDHAHRHGVIHRDIKPANILLIDGKPLVADFGIALAVSSGGAGRLTETGLSLGTPHYMSPEQATGDQGVGPATDLWALGCVLYEMLVGEPPYTASTPQAVLGKIITAEPPSAAEARRSVPANVDATIRKALEKVPADRFRSAGEFSRALTDPAFVYGSGGASEPGRRPGLRNGLAWAGSAVAFFAVVGVSIALRPEADPSVSRYPNPFLPGEEPVNGVGSFELSLDGTMVVYQHQDAAGTSLRVRSWSELSARPIEGTAGASQPVLSPDRRSVAFVQDGQIRAVDLEGGPVRTFGPGAAPYWATDGHVYVRSGDAVRYAQAGGPEEIVSALEEGEGGRRVHALLPDGERALLGLTPATGFEMRTIDLATGETLFLGRGEQPRYARSGHLLYLAERTLMAGPFDPQRGLTGPSVPMIEGVQYYSLADDGTLLYSTTVGGAEVIQLVWATRSGEISPVDDTWTFDRGTGEAWSFSPEGERVAHRKRASDGTYDIWVKDLRRGTETLVTKDEGEVLSPGWASDSSILYAARPRIGGGIDIRQRRSDGIGEPRSVVTLTTPAIIVSPTDAGLVLGWGAAQDIYWRPWASNDQPEPLLNLPGIQERDPSVSPDGRWIAYASNESGVLQVYVQPFPNVDEGKWTVSQDGGNSPKWSRDGQELYFRSADGIMMSVAIRDGRTFDHDPPQRLFPIPDDIDVPGARLVYDVTSDGRFVMSRAVDAGARDPQPGFVLVTNFFTELERLAPNSP